MLRLFTVLLFTATLSACATAPWRNTDKILKGMTTDQLVKYVGKPKSKIITPYYSDYLYDIASSPLDSDRSDTKTYVARLINGKIHSFGLYKGLEDTKINNYGKIQNAFKTAYLMPGNEGVFRQDLKFQYFAKQATQALRSKGIFVVDDIRRAASVIFLSYGISSENKKFSISSRPVYRWVAGQNYTSYINNSSGLTVGTINTYSNGGMAYSGQKIQSKTSTSYTTHIVFKAYRNTQGPELKPIWETHITSEKKSSDLKETIKEVLSMSANYIGEESSMTLSNFSFEPFY